MKSKKFEKYSLFTTKMPHFFSINKSKSGTDPKFSEFDTPDPIQIQQNML